MKKNSGKKRAIIFLLVLSVILTSFSLLRKTKDSKFSSLNKYFNGDTDTEYVGENAVVTAATITSRKTGTPNFDSQEGPGNDISEDDDVVRTFDTIKYTLNTNMSMKASSSLNSLKEGILNLEIVFPESCARIVRVNRTIMNWDEDIQEYYDDEGNFVIKAKYNLKNDDAVVIPGSQSLVVGIDVLNGKNNQEITPTFNMWLDGNNDIERQVVQADIVKVSAAPKYNVQLKQGNHLNKNVTLNYDDEDHSGKIFAYSVVLQLYNEEGKSVKGIEVPDGEISFDINLLLEKEGVDITSATTPLLWNYKVNSKNVDDGVIEGRNIKFDNSNTAFAYKIAPLGKATANRDESVFDSGNMIMEQNGNKITTKFLNYKFDSAFPKYDYVGGNYAYPNVDYEDNVGCFAAGYFQIFVENDEGENNENNYSLSLSDYNFKATSLSGDQISNQKNNTDDSLSQSFKQKNKVIFSQGIDINKYQTSQSLKSSSSSEDVRLLLDEKYELRFRNVVDPNSDADIHSADRIFKFDGDVVCPVVYDNGEKYRTIGSDGNMQFEVYYLTKKDGTNWIDESEKNNADVKELDVYDSMNSIPEGKKCIGIYIESKDDLINGEIPYVTSGQYMVYTPFKIYPSASVGSATSVVTRTWLYEQVLDRNLYSVANDNSETYPNADYKTGSIKYTAAKFNERGEVTEVSSEGKALGDTILVIAAEEDINIESINNQNQDNNTVFDLGKSQSEVGYKITPEVKKVVDTDIDGVTINIESKLPAGLSYVIGSFNKDEYSQQVGNDVNFNVISDPSTGETLLKWSIYNYTVGDNITPIEFRAKIDETSSHGTSYNVSAYIYGDMDKVGNINPDLRKKTTEIQIVNLASHRLYKEIVTPVVEKNDEIKYVLTYVNKTDSIDNGFVMLDVLPNNASENLFSGNYKVKQINVKQIVNGSEVSLEDLKLYGTNDQSVFGYDANNVGIGVESIWSEKSVNTLLNEEMTACAVKGNVLPGATIQVEIILDMKDSNEGDVYPNTVTARISSSASDSELLRATQERATVVARSISGMVWYDVNENGIKDEDESYAKDIIVKLTDESNNVIDSTTTSINGNYKFSSLAKKNYVVKIEGLSKYKLSEANVGTNMSLNSRFELKDGVMQSDMVTKLNSVDDPVLSMQFVNAGLIVKDAKVKVYYLDENGDEITHKDVDDSGSEIDKSYSYELNGKIDEDYSTEQLNIDGYKFVRSTGNTSGKYTEADKEVEYHYVYNRKDVEVTKIWQDNDNTANKRPNITIIELYANNQKVDEYEMLTSSNSSTHTFANKDKYDNNIEEITYTIKEKEKNEGDLKFYTSQVNNATYTITDTFSVPDEKVNVEATIKWEDSSNEAQKRPESIKVALFADGNERDTKEISDTSLNTNTVIFTNLSKYDSLGNEIVYSIDEFEKNQDDLKFYSKAINASNYTITNTFTVPQDKINVTATIAWDDNNNENNSRPESVTLYLKNKQNTETTTTVNNTAESYEFTNLAKYDSLGNEISYTVDINDIVGYDKRIDGMQITNIVKTYSIIASVQGNGGSLTDGNESVAYNGNSTKVIKITPDFGYKISKIKINGNETDFIPEEDDTYTLNMFNNVNENKEILVSFEKKDAVVIAVYVTEDGTPISKREVITGKYMDDYTTTSKEFNDYDLIETIGNPSGKMESDKTMVIYKYRKVTGRITMKVVDDTDSIMKFDNIKFKLEKLNDDNTIDERFTPIEVVTDNFGKFEISDLTVGRYRITQIEAKEGYVLNKDPLEFEINKDKRELELSFKNEKEIINTQDSNAEQIKNVNTGNTIIIIIVVLCVATLICVVLSIVLKKGSKKVNNKK